MYIGWWLMYIRGSSPRLPSTIVAHRACACASGCSEQHTQAEARLVSREVNAQASSLCGLEHPSPPLLGGRVPTKVSRHPD
jgi:hypothetical protein